MEINNIENGKITEKIINETKYWFWKEKEKLTKFQLRITKLKKEGEKTQVTKIQNKRGDITINLIETQRIIREYYEQLYANNVDTLDKMEKFLQRHKVSN